MKPSSLKAILSLLLSAGLLAGCSGSAPEVSQTIQPSPQPVQTWDVESLMAGMSLREKVGQLFLVRPDALDPSQTQEETDDSDAPGVKELTPAMEEMLEKFPVGGVVLFGKNLSSPRQVTAFNQALQEASSIPLFIGVDEEGGSVARLANHPGFDLPQYESAGAVGATGDPENAREMGRVIGAYLKEYGFNLDFAPVADVNTNPQNPVIGDRAFSSQPRQAAQMASAMAEGLAQEGIIPVFKHFPGHGDTAEDSHSGIAVTYKTAQEMESCEWIPFSQVPEGAWVMVGHIAAPEITGDLTPASLSPALVTGVLREQLGFEGLVVTDSLAMGAITQEYTPGQAALEALNAGCDLLLMPAGLEEAFEAVVTAVENGTLSQEQLDQSVERILEYKLEYGLLNG